MDIKNLTREYKKTLKCIKYILANEAFVLPKDIDDFIVWCKNNNYNEDLELLVSDPCVMYWCCQSLTESFWDSVHKSDQEAIANQN